MGVMPRLPSGSPTARSSLAVLCVVVVVVMVCSEEGGTDVWAKADVESKKEPISKNRAEQLIKTPFLAKHTQEVSDEEYHQYGSYPYACTASSTPAAMAVVTPATS